MKQTAVEFLVKELNEKAIFGGTIDRIVMNNIIEQAKEMEKQQIENAFYRGIQEGIERTISESLFFKKTPEQYYNETFKNK